MRPPLFLLGWGKNPDGLVQVSHKTGAYSENIFSTDWLKEGKKKKKFYLVFKMHENNEQLKISYANKTTSSY